MAFSVGVKGNCGVVDPCYDSHSIRDGLVKEQLDAREAVTHSCLWYSWRLGIVDCRSPLDVQAVKLLCVGFDSIARGFAFGSTWPF